MPVPMPPQPQAPQAAPQGQPAPKAPSKEGVAGMLTDIHSGLMKFKELVGGANMAPEIQEQLDMVIQGFTGVVEAVSGGGAEKPAPPAAPPQAPRPPMAQAKVPMNGGPGTKPAM